MEDHLKFDANGLPSDKVTSGPFAEAAIDVKKVKLSHGVLHVEGQRVGLEFSYPGLSDTNVVAKRVSVKGPGYDGSIRIEIQGPSDGDFTRALDAIFALNLASLIPDMPRYWQNYARKNFADPGANDDSSHGVAPEGSGPKAPDSTSHVDSNIIKKPVVLHQTEPEFSGAARALKYSGKVTIYFWVLPDGTTSHLSIFKPAGLGLDEQALYAVSKYKFKPATKNGKPITVDLYVDVNFQIL